MSARNLRGISLLMAGGILVPFLAAQSTPVPQSYSLTVMTSMALEAMTTNSAVEARISRFGPREFVEVTAAPKAGKAVHARHWFDLVAHKAYSLDVVKDTCTWMTYTGPDMPTMYDPVATPAPSAEDLAAFKKNTVRRENINGIATYFTETTSDQGKARVWIAVNGFYPVKGEVILPGAPPMEMLEIKELRFEKPSATLLAPPANCATQAQGEWSAQGFSVHAEMNVEAHGSGSVDLNSGKTKGEVTVKSGGQSQPH